MKKPKSQKFLVNLFLLFFFPTNLFSYQANHFVLENSLELFSIQDKNTTQCKVFYLNDAGFSIQDPETTGFAELYQKIFWKTNPDFAKASSQLMMSSIESYCQQEKAIFSYSVNAENLEKSLLLLSKQLKTPIYKDSDILEILTEIKKRETKLHTQPEGFISATIDSTVFSSSPWKRSSCAWPELIASYKPDKARTVLTKIQKEHYCSEKSTLVIVSPYTDEEVLDFVKSNFADWKRSGNTKKFKVEAKSNDTKNEKKFVLVTDAISNEFVQIAVQFKDEKFFYENENKNLARIYSVALENETSRFKQSLCENKKLGIIAEEYINANFQEENKNSRFIIQSLMQAGLTSPCDQEKDFLQAIYSYSKLEDYELYYAQKEIEKQNIFAQNSATEFAQSLIYKLGSGANLTSGAELNSGSKLDSGAELDSAANSNQFLDSLEKPYIFLIVNPSVYKKYSTNFQKNGYTVLTEKNALWYRQNQYKEITNSAQKAVIRGEFYGETYKNLENDSTLGGLQKLSPLERLIKNYEENSFSFSLSNNIPVFVEKNDQSSTSTILLRFEGGESPYAKNKHAMEKVLLKSFAKNIENQIKKSFSAGAITDIGNIQVNTQIYSGSIEISFLSQDFENVCKCINHAIAYSNITPGMEDEIILQEKSIWQFTSSQLLFQLKYKFLSKFFEKKEYSHLFSCTLDILQDVSFNEIALLYTKILDASKMSIIITGNTETSDDELKNLAEKTFSIIPSLSENRNLQTKITRENDSSIDFKDTAVVVQVKRIFGSDIEAKDAGPRPEHLIPTTEFLDPAIVVLTSPSKTGEDYANFILALSVLQEKMKNDTSFQTLASDIQLFQFDEIDGVYGLAFFEVESSKKLYNYFKTFTDKKFSITENDLKNAKISYIGSTYGNLSTSEDNAKMMNENLSSTGNAFYHIDFLKSLKNAQLQNVQKSYETYIKGCPVYWIFTGDTKK